MIRKLLTSKDKACPQKDDVPTGNVEVGLRLCGRYRDG